MIDEFHGSGHEPLSGQRPAADAGSPRSPARPPGGLTGLERGLDGGRDELRCLRIDDDVPAQQHAADDLPAENFSAPLLDTASTARARRSLITLSGPGVVVAKVTFKWAFLLPRLGAVHTTAPRRGREEAKSE